MNLSTNIMPFLPGLGTLQSQLVMKSERVVMANWW